MPLPALPPERFEPGPMMGYGAAGAGLSLLENASLFKDQPEEIKHINTVLGAVTGAAMSHPSTKVKATAMLSWPLKQVGLLATGKAEQFRRDQSGLLDKKMQAAEIDLAASEARRRAAGGNRAAMYAFLIPALLGGGGLAYYAWNKRKREQHGGRYATTDEQGRPHGKQRVKIDVPVSAMPDEFFKSLISAEDNPKSRIRLQEQQPQPEKQASTGYNPEDLQSYQDMWKKHWDRPGHNLLPEPKAPPTIPGQVASFASEFTGIPQFARGAREVGMSVDALGEGRHEDIGRYGLAGLGNIGMGISGLNMVTAPVLGKLLGRERVRDWVVNHSGKGPIGRQMTSFGTLGNWIHRRAFGNDFDKANLQRGRGMLTEAELAASPRTTQETFRSQLAAGSKTKGEFMRGGYNRARDTRYRYNPDKYAWDRPEVEARYKALNAERLAPKTMSGGTVMKGTAIKVPEPGALFKSLLTKPTGAPGGFWGSATNSARYAANRGVNTAYRAAMLARRNPNMSLFLASLPLAGMGLEKDHQKQEGVDNILRNSLPNYKNHQGYGGTPISGTLSNLLSMVGANAAPPIQSQL